MTDIERNKAGKKLFTVNGTDEVQLYDGTKINMNPELLTDIDRKIDEKIALQNRLLSLIGVKDGDPRYADVLIITDYVLALINEARVDEARRTDNCITQVRDIAIVQGLTRKRIVELKPDTTLEGDTV